jgi:hypothetical protein
MGRRGRVAHARTHEVVCLVLATTQARGRMADRGDGEKGRGGARLTGGRRARRRRQGGAEASRGGAGTARRRFPRPQLLLPSFFSAGPPGLWWRRWSPATWAAERVGLGLRRGGGCRRNRGREGSAAERPRFFLPATRGDRGGVASPASSGGWGALWRPWWSLGRKWRGGRMEWSGVREWSGWGRLL